MNQLVNHLDKFRRMSNNEFKPKLLLERLLGQKPLDGGLQHTQDFTKMFKNTLEEINVVLLKEPSQILWESLKKSLLRKDGKSSLIIEHGEYYNSK